jgi:hypothetical protein
LSTSHVAANCSKAQQHFHHAELTRAVHVVGARIEVRLEIPDAVLGLGDALLGLRLLRDELVVLLVRAVVSLGGTLDTDIESLDLRLDSGGLGHLVG